MNRTNPLILSVLQLWAYGPDSEVANEYPAIELFDMRHDFPMALTQSGMAVLLTFLNGRNHSLDSFVGIRRSVAIVIVDATEECVMSATQIRVNIPRNRLAGVFRADLPFAYPNIKTDHTYKVMVRDVSSGQMLGESFFHMYDPLVLGKEPHLWYTADEGGVVPQFDYGMCKSVNSEDMELVWVRFNLVSHFKDEPCLVPEVEVRVYLPNGKIESRFFRPECDDYDMREYHVTMPVHVNCDNRGICYAELLCMDYAIAGFVFSTNGPTESGAWEGKELACLDEYTLEECVNRFRLCLQDEVVDAGEEDNDNEDRVEVDDEEAESGCLPGLVQPADESLLAPLEDLIGLKTVKEKLFVYEKVVRFNKMREECGLPVISTSLHAMFLGSPGTGKTTVAKMMGAMLAKAGMLSRGHVITRERATLLGPNYSMEETNTLKAIEEAQGGVLLIDEAYQLFQQSDPHDPGKFVIETLMTALADEARRDWMLILAGYPDEMKRMFDMNPGLKSRIPDSNIYVFDDFSESELMEIAERYFERHQYSLSPDARVALAQRLGFDYSQRDKGFGNARYVVNMIQTEILPAMAVRVVSAGSGEAQALHEIQSRDIPLPVSPVRATRPRIGFCA
ncbi:MULTISPECIES: AAA family ATPase [Butyricimonas]|uniref:AAA family ATPase n=1 Tax=Butyricimonas TaxID=574697 RepID=UPI0007FB431D|nr:MULTISPECIES: AAA family ATPase [Butyricimonas]